MQEPFEFGFIISENTIHQEPVNFRFHLNDERKTPLSNSMPYLLIEPGIEKDLKFMQVTIGVGPESSQVYDKGLETAMPRLREFQIMLENIVNMFAMVVQAIPNPIEEGTGLTVFAPVPPPPLPTDSPYLLIEKDNRYPLSVYDVTVNHFFSTQEPIRAIMAAMGVINQALIISHDFGKAESKD